MPIRNMKHRLRRRQVNPIQKRLALSTADLSTQPHDRDASSNKPASPMIMDLSPKLNEVIQYMSRRASSAD